MKTIQSRSVQEAWSHVLEQLPLDGVKYSDQDGTVCREYRNCSLSIENASDGQALVQALRRCLPELYPSIEELQAQTFSVNKSMFEWSIGSRLFDGQGQIDSFIIPMLSANPLSRRAIAVCYDNRGDSNLDSQNVPCIISIQFRVIDGSLDVNCTMRSCDAYLGLPANAWQVQALQVYVANKLNLPSGNLVMHIASLHWFASYDQTAPPVITAVKRLLAANGTGGHPAGSPLRKLYK